MKKTFYNVTEKVLLLFNRIPHDKIAHMAVGSILFICLFFSTEDILFSFAVVVIVGLLKEVYDSFSDNHTTDFYDALFTSIPAIIAIIVYLIRTLIDS